MLPVVTSDILYLRHDSSVTLIHHWHLDQQMPCQKIKDAISPEQKKAAIKPGYVLCQNLEFCWKSSNLNNNSLRFKNIINNHVLADTKYCTNNHFHVTVCVAITVAVKAKGVDGLDLGGRGWL